MNSTPLTITALNAEPELHVWPAGQGVGSGAGEPGSCGSPAETAEASAQTRTRETSSLFIDSPCAEVVDDLSGFTARTPHHIAQGDEDLALYRTLADRKDFDSLIQLCRERLLTAKDGLTSLRWTKDRAIVEALRENFTGAYDLLASAHWLAQTVTGTPRAKYELEFGIVLARLGRSSLSLDRFNVSFRHYHGDGLALGCARVDTARARALVTRGEALKALRYLSRAERIATECGDYRLLADVYESKAMACGSLAATEGGAR
jgi:hypothetical protein